ncbi:MAG: type IV toxin-antitoxin system AbiEi family antitoxin domain-containing protein [Deltaproteobacteria bacterium]|nr:type IV toxin-antitoxin system AbiEi family antitoxin domain-containing protein [Deltaproteobacteria bacterium]
MDKGSYIPALLRSQKTVFSFKDIALLWNSPTTNAARVRVNYYVKKGELVHLRKGLYAKDENYNRLELATKICIPSYVSFETVLAKAGIIFQVYGQIFVASYLTREVGVGGQTYSFRKIKNIVLTHPMGMENRENCSIANMERALLDTMYLNTDYHFDNLGPINWDKAFEILAIYKNKRMEKSLKKLHENFNAEER